MSATITPDTISKIIGTLGESNEHEQLAIADRHAKAFVGRGEGVLMSSANSDHYAAFEDVAKQAGLADLEELDRALDSFDAKAGEVACNRYAPVLSAAYYFGVALALRLNGEGGA